MRIKLTKDSMDIVMSIVRKYNISLEDSIEFIINNPQEIAITRGEIENITKAKIRPKTP